MQQWAPSGTQRVAHQTSGRARNEVKKCSTSKHIALMSIHVQQICTMDVCSAAKEGSAYDTLDCKNIKGEADPKRQARAVHATYDAPVVHLLLATSLIHSTCANCVG